MIFIKNTNLFTFTFYSKQTLIKTQCLSQLFVFHSPIECSFVLLFSEMESESESEVKSSTLIK